MRSLDVIVLSIIYLCGGLVVASCPLITWHEKYKDEAKFAAVTITFLVWPFYVLRGIGWLLWQLRLTNKALSYAGRGFLQLWREGHPKKLELPKATIVKIPLDSSR